MYGKKCLSPSLTTLNALSIYLPNYLVNNSSFFKGTFMRSNQVDSSNTFSYSTPKIQHFLRMLKKEKIRFPRIQLRKKFYDKNLCMIKKN